MILLGLLILVVGFFLGRSIVKSSNLVIPKDGTITLVLNDAGIYVTDKKNEVKVVDGNKLVSPTDAQANSLTSNLNLTTPVYGYAKVRKYS